MARHHFPNQTVLCLVVVLLLALFLSACSEEPAPVLEHAGKKPESHYRDLWCAEHGGWTEAPISSEIIGKKGARCDCLTETHAVEVDFCPKWAEAIGQSLYYAARTGKSPGIVLVCEEGHVQEYAARLDTVLNTYRIPATVWIMDASK
jgi:hypothetical protein